MAKKEWQVRQETTLLNFLVQFSGISKKELRGILGASLVCVNGEPIRQASHVLNSGDKVTIEDVEKVKKSDVPFEILYEDDDLIAINKPSGLLCVSAGLEKEKTAYHLVREYLRKKNPRAFVFVVHRLDRDTSGVLLFAKNEAIQQKLQANWNETVKVRGYLAIVEGTLAKSKGTLKDYLSESKTQVVYVSNPKVGKLAITNYEVLKTDGRNTLVQIYLETGRKNQIRVQFANMKHPLLGDNKYNPHYVRGQRLCLHANRIAFEDPRTSKLLSIEAPNPDFLTKYIKK